MIPPPFPWFLHLSCSALSTAGTFQKCTDKSLHVFIQGHRSSLVAQLVKNPPAMWENWVLFYPWVGKIPRRRERLPTPVLWPEEFHGLSMGLQRVGHDVATFPSPCRSLHDALVVRWAGHWTASCSLSTHPGTVCHSASLLSIYLRCLLSIPNHSNAKLINCFLLGNRMD